MKKLRAERTEHLQLIHSERLLGVYYNGDVCAALKGLKFHEITLQIQFSYERFSRSV